MVIAAAEYGIELPDRELACAPINSAVGQAYLGAMRAAINCALANRQVITHLVRQVFADILPHAQLPLLYDVSHKSIVSMVNANGSSYTARGQPALLALGTRIFPQRCAVSVSRF